MDRETKKKLDLFSIVCLIIAVYFSLYSNYSFAIYRDFSVETINENVKEAKQNAKKRNDVDAKNKNRESCGKNFEEGSICAQNGTVLMDACSGEILFEKGDEKIAQMASTTKIMTCVLALENIKDMERFYKVNREAIEVEGTSMGLKKGDFVNMNGLIVGMLLLSGNDAANETAIRVVKELIERGTIKLDEEEKKEMTTKKYIEKFVELMNSKALELGLKNTKFSSPSGLGPEDVLYSDKYKKNETTAKELAILARYAMQNSVFRKVCGSVRSTVEILHEKKGKTKKEKRTYYNSNRLIKKGSGFFYKNATGIKTGFTKEAGRCLVASAKKDGVELIAVVLKDKEDWVDCINMFEYGFSKYEKIDVTKKIPEKDRVEKKKFKVIGLEGTDRYFTVKVEKPIKYSVLKNRLETVEFKTKIRMNPVWFNVKEDEKVGKIEYYMLTKHKKGEQTEKLIGTANLLCESVF